MNKTILGVLVISAMFMSFGLVSGHEATSFNPEDSNCMGKLISFHAQDPSNGLRNTYENYNNGNGMPHNGIANKLGVPGATTFQEFMKLNQMWCKSE